MKLYDFEIYLSSIGVFTVFCFCYYYYYYYHYWTGEYAAKTWISCIKATEEIFQFWSTKIFCKIQFWELKCLGLLHFESFLKAQVGRIKLLIEINHRITTWEMTTVIFKWKRPELINRKSIVLSNATPNLIWVWRRILCATWMERGFCTQQVHLIWNP